jgi:uncharacterized RDD family membrane protein YckC
MGGMESNVKCPECGFVSSSVIPQCEQCGHRFPLAAHSETVSSLSRPAWQATSSRTYWESPAPATSDAVEHMEPFDSQNVVATVARESDSVPGSEKAAGGEPTSDHAPAPQLAPNNAGPTVAEERWRNELTRRVQRFRRRRAHLRESFNTGTSLEFDFQGGRDGEPDPLSNAALAEPGQLGEEFDAVLGGGEERKESIHPVDSIPLRGRKEVVEFPGEAIDLDAEERGLLVETRRRRRLDPAAMSIVMESSATDEPEATTVCVLIAPLGPRFLAGVVDGLMLLLAMACFVAIFWWVVGEHLHWRPVDLGVLACVAGFLVFSYFALFGRLASATIGQQAVGLVLRNLEGGAPTSAQALWRAFGYLVSLSSLMLGFVWAMVDSEGLTWHDRMSGTLLVSRYESVPANVNDPATNLS